MSREAAAEQVERHRAAIASPRLMVDFALGTGESLLEVHRRIPGAKLVGVDISEKMLDVARTKLDVGTIHDDARNVCRHVEAGSADLVLAHFVATYVDAETLARNAATILRSGGLFSFVNGTREGYRTLQGLASQLMPEEKLRELAPSPESPSVLERACTDAGFDIVESRSVSREISFASFQELYDFAFHAGWFTHLLAGLGDDVVAHLSSANGLFPLHDEFRAAVVLAAKR